MDKQSILKLAAIMKQEREKRNLSQTQLAIRINRSPQLICDIEAKRKGPSLNTIVLMAKELGFSLDDLFFSS